MTSKSLDFNIERIQQKHWCSYCQKVKNSEPLKKVILADGLEETEYFYTLQGALKRINNPDDSIDKAFEMTLSYYTGDYTNSHVTMYDPSELKDDYSGNISAQSWKRSDPDGVGEMTSMHYTYDNKGQLLSASNHIGNNFNVGNLTYDANGNMQSVRRFNDVGQPLEVWSEPTNDETPVLMYHHQFDNYIYDYEESTPKYNNRLNEVRDSDGSMYAKYKYNSIGQMILSTRNNPTGEGFEIWNYDYDVSGKVKRIWDDQGDVINYAYDEKGFRIGKNADGDGIYETAYVRDASGNLMAIYAGEGNELTTEEYPIYGAGKIGTFNAENDLHSYELTDHLGNVRVVLTDAAVITESTDYYPFGLKMNVGITGNYRYGYQGEFAEEDDETGFNHFEARDYDAVMGRWMIRDPARQYPSPYLGMGNNPINGVDPDGRLFGKFRAQLSAFFNGGEWWQDNYAGQTHLKKEFWEQ